jgi:ArsR family transcriptional regulator
MKTQTDTGPTCCPEAEPEFDLRPVEGAPADEELAALSKAVAHPARVRILRLLSRKEARVCSEIVGELPLAQSTVSEHLRILKEAGLIRSREDGPRVGYCINSSVLRRFKALVAIL